MMKKPLNRELIRQVMEELIPFNRWLGIQLEAVDPGKAELLIPFREEFVGDPRVQRLHGGVIATLLDVTGGAAAMTTLTSRKDQIATVDLRVDYLRPALPEAVHSLAEVVYSGDRIVFTRMMAFQGSKDQPIAEARGVYHVIRLKANPQEGINE